MSRPAFVDIDLSAAQHNYQLAKQHCGNKVLAVIKADAYGHGAVQIAKALTTIADGFAVACLEEAIELRNEGITNPILLLEGFFSADELPLIAQHHLFCAVHQQEQIDSLLKAEIERPIPVWLKLNSGMHRIGFEPDEYQAAWAALRKSNNVDGIVKMTHLARADELNSDATSSQYERFCKVTADLPGENSISNSPGLMGWSHIPNDWGRAGLMLYGVTPFPQPMSEAEKLKPVMSFKSKVISVREIAAGSPIGYGATFITNRRTRVGIVAAGYADGYPRHAPSGTPVLVNGMRVSLLGRVSMDMLAIDLTDTNAELGAEVELWGAGLSAAEVAMDSGTIPYQLFCNIKRVPFNYHY